MGSCKFCRGTKTQSVAMQVMGLGAIALLLTSCASALQSESNPATPSSPKLPKVVATSTIIADLTETIAGDEVEVVGLLRPGDDPHIYEPVPENIKDLETADLILYNGFDLEPALIRLLTSAGQSAEQLAVGEVVQPLDLEKAGQKQPDPHVWGDAENAIAMTQVIRDALTQLSPEDQALFAANAAQLTQKLETLDRWIISQIQTIPPSQRKLVTTHDAFQYYARAYGLEMLGTLIGISTEEQPSVQTVQQLVQAIRTAQIRAIFAETTINPQLIRTVATEAGVKLAPEPLYSDSIGVPGSSGDSYLKMMEANTRSIVEALGGKFTAFEVKSGDEGR